jgi:DNA modification methylase
MLNNSSPGQVVYEPFLGSGTTLIAAETCGRSCLAMELSPAYVDVAIRRWQDFTGDTAVHAGGGSFTEIAPRRGVATEQCPAESNA